MQITASAPGKVILFGEHAVVYGRPAIAIAVNKYAHVTIGGREDSKIYVESVGLGISGFLDIENEVINCEDSKLNTGILKYILKSLRKLQTELDLSFTNGLDISLDLEMPVGTGLGSSAAVTVATLAAVINSQNRELEPEKIASLAHQVELEVQGAASPIDTTLSTYGGAIYLSNTREIVHLPLSWDIPLVIGYTERESNTGELIESVRLKKEKYPLAINLIFDSVEQVTEKACKVLLEKDAEKLGELFNINHGLLDALGVSTPTVSHMVYLAREAGALGSKITGAGGGGSIIAFCPGMENEVLFKLQKIEKAFPVQLNKNGFKIKKG